MSPQAQQQLRHLRALHRRRRRGRRVREVLLLLRLRSRRTPLWFGSGQFGARLRAADPRARTRPCRRGEAAGAARQLPTFIPFFGAYVTVRHANTPPWRSALVSLAGPFAGGLAAAAVWAYGRLRTRPGSSCSPISASCSTRSTCFRSASSTEAHVGRRRGDTWHGRRAGTRPACRCSAAPDRARALDRHALRPASGRARRGCMRPPQWDARAPRMQDLDFSKTHHALEYLREKSKSIAEEFRRRLRGGRADRPAGGYGLRLGPRAGGIAGYEPRANRRGCSREAGWAVVTGGGPARWRRRTAAAARAAGSRSASRSCCRTSRHEPYLDLGLEFHHFYARKTMFVKAAEGFASSRAASARRRAVRVADADPDGGDATSRSCCFGAAYWGPLLGWVRRSALAHGKVARGTSRSSPRGRAPGALATVHDAFRAINGSRPARAREGRRAVAFVSDGAARPALR